ncbi:MAG: cytochrome c, partial [Pseudohongiella sp.]|nr:cytochrome c [Pseudohongiella sp.]
QRVADVSTLTPDESARAGQLYAAQCAVCHGAQGQGIAGGSAPSLRNARDQQQVRAMINNGAVEMPAFALRLAADDIELLSRYVSEGALVPSGSVPPGLVPPDLVPPVELQ